MGYVKADTITESNKRQTAHVSFRWQRFARPRKQKVQRWWWPPKSQHSLQFYQQSATYIWDVHRTVRVGGRVAKRPAGQPRKGTSIAGRYTCRTRGPSSLNRHLHCWQIHVQNKRSVFSPKAPPLLADTRAEQEVRLLLIGTSIAGRYTCRTRGPSSLNRHLHCWQIHVQNKRSVFSPKRPASSYFTCKGSSFSPGGEAAKAWSWRLASI